MGKASKWIRNLLLGKREEKINKKDTSCKESLVISKAIIPATVPVEKRRWSFGRSSSTDKSTHKTTRSFDSIITPQLVSQALLEYANLQQHQRAPPMVVTTKSNTPLPSTRPTAPKRGPGPAENAAATKIQASFRSYLARKALCALRGLVKLQALVRGHLVRKQTTAMIRCMNALMSIQVRARVQRIQLAEESYLVTKTRKVNREQAQENMLSRGYRKEIKELKGMGGMKGQNGYLNHPQSQTDTMEHRLSTYSSGRISVSRREHQRQLYPISSPSTHTSSRTYDQQVEGLSLSRGHTSSQHYSSRAMFVDTCISSSAVHGDIGSSDQQFEPSYMAKTKSSKAKVRSQSEPKQRPVEKKSRRSASNEGITTLAHSSSSHLRGDFHKNQNHWLVKLYRSSKSIKDIEFDSTSTSTNNSSYCRTLLAYEILQEEIIRLDAAQPSLNERIRIRRRLTKAYLNDLHLKLLYKAV